MSSKDELYADLFSTNQHRLFGYILAMVRNRSDAQDILQQTAITLWKKFDDFEPGTDFIKWAITVARYETLNFIKYRRRSRVYFDQSLMEQLGNEFSDLPMELVESRRTALNGCIGKLPQEDRKLIESRYSHGLGSRQLAELLDRSQASICNSLKRIREALLRCVTRATAKEDF